ncbi:MAG: fimbria/pilus periplasmic chaperone [Colwellia sp.]|jgi:P pilus assembly protein, chaperone PapD
MPKSIILVKILLVISFLHILPSQASLLISPLRAMLNERDRSATIILINSGDKTRTYRVGWTEKSVTPAGGYHELTKAEQKKFPIASPMLRVSPRQVTLAPGERQMVKVAARRPKGLADGEYRSHLTFTILPEKNLVEERDIQRAAGIKLNVFLNYSIPVLFRQGNLTHKSTIKAVKLVKNKKTGTVNIHVNMSHAGKFSTTGSIFAYWTPNGSDKETLVGTLNSVNFFPEVPNRMFTLMGQKFNPKKGKLRVIYEGRKEFVNQVFHEKTFSMTANDIN